MSIARLIAIPALITLAVTLLRLVGELQNWSPVLFGRTPGGGGALVGIAWLVPIFGIYFALRLARAEERPASSARAIGWTLASIVCFFAIGAAEVASRVPFVWILLICSAGSVAVILLARRAWPQLWKTLLAYGIAARIPVIIVMLFAILGDWGTHYDAPAEDAPPMVPLEEFLWTGLLPQLTFWIAYTVVVGSLFGGIAYALVGRGKPAAEATASAASRQ